MPDILGRLEMLADLHAQQRAIRQAQAVALPARVRAQLAAVEARFAPELATVAAELALVEQQVRAAVYPEVLSLRSVGTPSVTVRKVIHD